MYALYRKELADHVDSVRFLIILIIAFLLAGVSLYSALGGIATAGQGDASQGIAPTPFTFLQLFVQSNGTIPSLASFIALVGPIIGLLLGFDAINSEKNAGTLNRLLAQPIYRDAVINGKFLAGLTVVVIIVAGMVLIVSGVGLFRTGIPPTGEEVMRLLVFAVFSIVYIAFWLGLSILLSVVTRSAATSALLVVAVWLLFAFFISLISSGIAGALYSPDTVTGLEGAATFQQSFDRISPTILYSESVGTILDPTVRTLGITSVAQYDQLSAGVAGVLPMSQSLLLVWPHLVGMIALMLGAFAISYIVFMKQEIRGA
ncbi:MAG: ABC transporter permease [Clostridiales bacterium]|nr:ABC transporter permease [Clostridiales bacterium]